MIWGWTSFRGERGTGSGAWPIYSFQEVFTDSVAFDLGKGFGKGMERGMVKYMEDVFPSREPFHGRVGEFWGVGWEWGGGIGRNGEEA
ncbi:hypothetical protein PoB_000771600 [Plakobranchus ocellatus]|uniref:Uncharacterized protein n=1 Tax=Plakobranchus ocellatus TaxID=259542 RepID=A0AAV3YDF6_9GAST|nr:hypothetical protein PoB_000771600 [Plakobranchus ocellatus]